MKASELIAKLAELIYLNGDLYVYGVDQDARLRSLVKVEEDRKDGNIIVVVDV